MSDSDAAPGSGSKSLIEYPSAFPIKVMGVHAEGFTEAMVAVTVIVNPR